MSPIFLSCFIMQCFSQSENNQIGYGKYAIDNLSKSLSLILRTQINH